MPTSANLHASDASIGISDLKVGVAPTDESTTSWRPPQWIILAGPLAIMLVLLVGAFEAIHAGKILPGISADGVNLSGLTPAAASTEIAARIAGYQDRSITINSPSGATTLPVSSLGLSYDIQAAVSQAQAVGHDGSIASIIADQARALFGATSNFSSYKMNTGQFASVATQMAEQVATPVTDASLSFAGNTPGVSAGQAGSRLDVVSLVQMLDNRVASTSSSAVTAPIYKLEPALSTSELTGAFSQISAMEAGPVTLDKPDGSSTQISQDTIASWMYVSQTDDEPFLDTQYVGDLVSPMPSVNLELNPAKIQTYVANLAQTVNVAAQNATLTWSNNRVSVVAPSVDGKALNQADAYQQIVSSLHQPASNRLVSLKIDTTSAPVNQNNLASLGITQLLSQGVTNDYPSPAARLTNIELGADRFNNVLLSPGQEFSFGQILGPATPAQGYQEGWVILGNKEVEAPGGGLCQLVTTAFRAALLAGLPITERLNHAFAIPYYTWPYGVPGVDATIYYPELDLKFINNTGHYILMQTNVDNSNNTVTYSFYGTKTKVGVIRGPYFVTSNGSLSSDPNYAPGTEASHTVFYRDIENLSGKVIETDTFNSYYQPSTDFPPESD